MRWMLCVVACLAACETRLAEDAQRRSAPSTEPAEDGDSSEDPPVYEPPPPPTIQRTERHLPALSGGTLAAGTRIVAADPERDVLWIVDPESRRLLKRLDLRPGDEPGRVMFHGARVAWVALRGSGDVVRLDVEALALTGRWPACGSARGLASSAERVAVACAEGEVVQFDFDGRELDRRFVAPDLRDVVFYQNTFHVTTFRAAELISVEAGTVLRPSPVNLIRPLQETREHFTPGVAWRTRQYFGRVHMLHQRMQATPLTASQAVQYYVGGPCGTGVLHAALAEVSGDEQPRPAIPAVLPLDWALELDGGRVAVVDGASDERALAVYEAGAVTWQSDDCAPEPLAVMEAPYRLTSVDWIGAGKLVAFSREPLGLVFFDQDGARWTTTSLDLPGPPLADTGHFIFHFGYMGRTSCASCHPEGGDDGHVWTFPEEGARRTQPLFGGLMDRAPFHWDGSLEDLGALSDAVLTGRMGGRELHPLEVDALGRWLAGLRTPAPPPVDDPEAEARGEDLFATQGCTDCHGVDGGVVAGSHDVGTGGVFQVPSLAGLAHRAPYMHDGCAPTLADRFDPACGGDAHGATDLNPQQIQDLVAFLRRL